MITVSIQGLRLFGFHGLHAEEKKVKSEFVVHMDISYMPAKRVEAIDETINYAEVVELVKQRMNQPEALLETLAGDLADLVFTRWGFISAIVVKIEKKKAPLHKFTGQVSVTYRKQYD